MNILVAPLEALTDTHLSDPELRVLLALFSFRGRDTNTVWPSLDSLAKRARLKDKTRVSKLTRSLCEKGWLTKKKRGFTGGNLYTLSVPSKLGSDAKLDAATKLAPPTKSNLDAHANSNLDSAAKNKEQTSEQTNEQSREEECDNTSKTQKRGTRLPDDWKLTSEYQEAALKIRPELAEHIEVIADIFRDYWQSVTGQKAIKRDWLATWRNWIRNEKHAAGQRTQFKTAQEKRSERNAEIFDYDRQMKHLEGL